MDEIRKEKDKERDTRRAEMIKSLKDDGIIAKDADNVSIHINEQEMIVNGVKQPDNIFNKYREKMGKKPTQPSAPKPAVAPVLKLSPSTFKPEPIKLDQKIRMNPSIKLDPVIKKPLATRQFTDSKPQPTPAKTT